MKPNIQKIVRRVLSEMDFSNLDKLIEFGDYAKSFSKSGMRKINKFLLLIRELGVVNMFQAGDFLIMSPEYFKDFMRLKSYERDFDEEVLSEIEDMLPEITTIMIGAGIKLLENSNSEVTPKSVERAIRRLASTTVKYYMLGLLPKE